MIRCSVSVGLYLFFFCCLCFSAFAQVNPVSASTCISGPSTWYRGTIDRTVTGILCQRWDTNTPHKPKLVPRDGGNHNYCRNPDNDLSGTWCYTTSADVRWQHCNIPKCPDDSLLLMTSRKSPNQTWIFQVPADPELSVGNISNPQPALTYVGNNYIWSVASDKREERAFFADYKANYLGIYSFATNTTVTRFNGRMDGVEELAYDWVTGNLYWSDSYKHWIMATNDQMEHTVLVYKNSEETVYGLALHSKLRLLFFSTRNNSIAKIKRSDLAGTYVSTLHTVTGDVRSLAVDYTDDRLYWAVNNPRSRVTVMSCLTDGSNLTNHALLTRTRAWGIAAYLNTIYITDQSDYYHFRRGFYYKMKLLPKDTGIPQTISYFNKVKGLSVYSDNEEYSIDNSSSIGTCFGMPPCDHVCLPTNTTRICACALGYVKTGDTGCGTRPLEDNYMLVADLTLKQIFQVSLNSAEKNYSVLPIGPNFVNEETIDYKQTSPDISAMTLNVVSKTIYWFDRTTSTMFMSSWEGTNITMIQHDIHVVSMATDHVTGNLYFADDDTENIYVMDATGRYVKTLMTPSEDRQLYSSIRSLSLDSINKYVYWVDFNGTVDTGQLWRMSFNGTNQQLVLEELFNPRAVYVDDKRGKIFISVGKKRFAVVYEMMKTSLENPNGSIPSDAIRYDIPGLLGNAEIVELYNENATLYLATNPHSGIRMVDLTQRPLVGEKLQNDFYKPRFFSIYREDEARMLYVDALSNPCDNLNTPCSQICIPTSNITRVCTCQDGVDASLENCGKILASLDRSPSYGNTCSDDVVIETTHCGEGAPFTLITPEWTDDITARLDLRLVSPLQLELYPVGTHTFTFTATDESGNVGHCSYTLTITRPTCDLPDEASIPGTLLTSPPACENGEPGYFISCLNPALQVAFGGFVNGSLWNPCETRTNQFLIPSLNSVTCVKATPKSSKPEGANTTSATPIKESTDGSGLSQGATAAIIVIVLLVVVVFGVVIYTRRRRKKRFHVTQTQGHSNPTFSWAKEKQTALNDDRMYRSFK